MAGMAELNILILAAILRNIAARSTFPCHSAHSAGCCKVRTLRGGVSRERRAARLKRAQAEARYLCEAISSACDEIENRSKEYQLDLFADRTSAATMRANQLRLWSASPPTCC